MPETNPYLGAAGEQGPRDPLGVLLPLVAGLLHRVVQVQQALLGEGDTYFVFYFQLFCTYRSFVSINFLGDAMTLILYRTSKTKSVRILWYQ